MRTRAVLRLLAALSVLALVAAACGDDDEPTAVGTADDATADDETADGHDADGHDDDGHDDDGHDDDGHDGDMADGEMADGQMADHDHGLVEVDAANAPSVDLEVFADPAGGINIHVITDDYTVSPRAASTDHVEGEGHFHLYIDGKKVQRFYNEWIYFAGVTEGDVDVMVELSANDHRAYAVDGEKLTASATFTVPPHEHSAHSHDEPVAVEVVGAAPTVALEVVDDPKSGWNAFITLDGMTLSAENASTEHVDGEGHLHIYANGQKLGRLYGLATHLGTLPEGDVEISVVAYTNDHQPYEADGQPISAVATVTVAS